MKSKLKYAICTMSTIMIFVLTLYLAYKYSPLVNSKQNLFCRFNTTLNNNGMTIPMVGIIRYNNESGILFFDGPVSSYGKGEGYISREVHFRGEMNENRMVLMGSEMIFNSKDSLSQIKAEKILPDFFVKNHARIVFTLEQQGKDLIFINDNVPMFFCELM